MTVEAGDMKEDTILQNDTPKMTLKHNGENIFRGFKRGSHIFATHNDINCLESTSLITTGNNNQMEVDQVVTHVEYTIKIHNVTLIVNQHTGQVIDKSSDRQLDCPKHVENCTYDLENYI